MKKLEIYAELLARFIVLLIASPFTIFFLICYAAGFIAEYFFSSLFTFVASTKLVIASIDNQTKENEPKTKDL